MQHPRRHRSQQAATQPLREASRRESGGQLVNPAAFSADLLLQTERGGTWEGRRGDIAKNGEEIGEESGRRPPRPRVRRGQQATAESDIAMEGEEIGKGERAAGGAT